MYGKKIVVACILGLLVFGGLWWLLSPSGSDTDGGGMADVEIRMEQAGESNKRAREANREIGASVERVEERSQRIESGIDEIESAAGSAREILERDRASLERIGEIIRNVEERRTQAANKSGA